MPKLAIDGGKPVRRKPFPPRIIFDKREKEAILRVVKKTMTGPEAIDLLAHGPEVESFKKEFAKFYGVQFATTATSGTAALHTAISALRLNPGIEIITTPITDAGTVSAILMANCIPVFADVDYETLNITASSIERVITEKTKVIIPVHLAGQPCDMDPIMELAREYDLIVIEDCSQAHAAKYKGKYVGTIGQIGAFSLNAGGAGKHITSGGQGGMIITNDEEIYWNAKRFADRGKPFNSPYTTNLFLGLNYRMTELQAAIGRVQLKKLKQIARKRRTILKKLQAGLKNLKAIKLWSIIEDAEPNPWFCFLHYDKEKMKVSREHFVAAVNAEGIPALRGQYITILYDQLWIKEKKTYGDSGCPWTCLLGRYIDYTGSCPNAEKALADYMTLWIHECWTDDEIHDTIEALQKVEKEYLK